MNIHNNLTGSKVLVTGGQGFVAQHLNLSLSSIGAKVYTLDIIPPKHSSNNPNVIQITSDILDFESMELIFKKIKPDFVFHLAAKVSVLDSERFPDEYILINEDGSENIARLCAQYNVKKVIFFSTGGAMYNYNFTINEKTKPNPISVYGRNKLNAEIIMNKILLKSRSNFSIIRPANIYGPSVNYNHWKPHGVIDIFIRNMMEKNDVIIFGDCSRDYIYVEDVIKIAIATLFSDIPIVLAASGKSINTKDLFHKISKYLHYDLDPIIKNIRHNEVKSISFNVDKVIESLSIMDLVLLDEGLLRTINQLKKNYKDIL